MNKKKQSNSFGENFGSNFARSQIFLISTNAWAINIYNAPTIFWIFLARSSVLLKTFKSEIVCIARSPNWNGEITWLGRCHVLCIFFGSKLRQLYAELTWSSSVWSRESFKTFSPFLPSCLEYTFKEWRLISQFLLPGDLFIFAPSTISSIYSLYVLHVTCLILLILNNVSFRSCLIVLEKFKLLYPLRTGTANCNLSVLWFNWLF